MIHQTSLFGQFLGGFAQEVSFKSKLLPFDATTIDLCLSLLPWAKSYQTKGVVKLHLLLDHDGYLPVYASICEPIYLVLFNIVWVR